jgi:ribosomal protein S18 acetylase RimI-like enzyme
VHAGPVGDLTDVPDDQWMAMFLGPGLDPVDGASRSRALSRAAHTRFASVRDAQGRTLACGAAGFGHGWLSVHGMRTAVELRQQGLAGRVLLTMAREAARRGVKRVFLQVDAGNEAALALYRRAGMATAWPYAYWRAG